MSFDNLELDHIAIAVKNFDESVKLYRNLGLNLEKVEKIASQGVVAAFFNIGDEGHLELLNPLKEEGVIFDFLNKKGPGIHHICFRVNDLEVKIKELEEKGFKMVYKENVKGAGDSLINFVHPKTTGGILIELKEEDLV
mgnify:CR=1 FL=1